ncbi:MAG TPA: S9 family peptidase [Bacillota bacterium]|nr:S9 family peptidase [Bacillota bacterium]
MDDYFALRLLGEPAVSPDGSRIAFTVQTCDRAADRDRSAIWLASTGASDSARPLTAGTARDRSPRWSPDGQSLAFISDRADGRPQIHIIPADGGEARRVATEPAVSGGLVWSPDGSRLAFVGRVLSQPDGWPPYAGAPEGDAQRARAQAAGIRGDTDVKVVTRVLYRMDGLGEYGDRRSHVFTVPASGDGPATQVTDGDFDHGYPAFSPDGRFLAMAANRRPAQEADLDNHTDLWGCEVANRRMFLLCSPGGSVLNPAWSPDGRRLAFVADDASAGRTTSPGCWVVAFAGADAPAQTPTCISRSLDRPVSYPDLTDLRLHTVGASVAWSWDGRHVYFPVFDQGVTAVYRAAPDGTPEVVTETPGPNGRTFGGFATGGPGPVVAYTGGDAVTPEELFAFRPGEAAIRLSAINASHVAGLALQPVRRFRYAGADGWPIEGWFMPAAGCAGRPAPCVVHVHGGPHSAYSDAIQFTMQLLAAAGIASLYVNPRGSQGYGQTFASACAGDWGGKDFLDIMAGCDHAVAAGWADPDRLGLTGYSYGGYMTCWAVTQTGRFRAALAGAPIANRHSFYGTSDIGVHFGETEFPGNAWESEDGHLARSALRFAARVSTPILFQHGEADLRCPIAQTEEYFVALRRQGKTAVMVRYPGEFHSTGGHSPRHKQDRMARMIAWFQHWLLG